MIDLRQLKVGDTYRVQKGQIYKCFTTRETHFGFMINDMRYRDDGKSDYGYSDWDIVEIIPKVEPVLTTEKLDEMFNKTWRNEAAYVPKERELKPEIIGTIPGSVFVKNKPKRFVDLLADGEEYIHCIGRFWTVYEGEVRCYNPLKQEWEDGEGAEISLFEPATPAQNPERKKKVVYQVLYKDMEDGLYGVTSDKYATVAEFAETPLGNFTINARFIEESREEIEE